MSIITLDKLSLGYRNKTVINDFSADINPGDFVGIFGPNGAGKSTLLRAIIGLIKPQDGQILVLNKPAQKGNPEIGYVCQFKQFSFTHRLSARTYLKAVLNGFRWGLPRYSCDQLEKIEEVIQLTHLTEFIDRPYLQLSGGERQKVMLAEALLDKPKILLLDEPLSGLDPSQQEKMIHLIARIQQQLHITVLFTAHDINPLLGIMNRVIYLTQGKAAIGSVDEIVNSEKLSWLYDAPIEIIHHHNHVLVVHQKLGTSIHAHDHFSHS